MRTNTHASYVLARACMRSRLDAGWAIGAAVASDSIYQFWRSVGRYLLLSAHWNGPSKCRLMVSICMRCTRGLLLIDPRFAVSIKTE